MPRVCSTKTNIVGYEKESTMDVSVLKPVLELVDSFIEIRNGPCVTLSVSVRCGLLTQLNPHQKKSGHNATHMHMQTYGWKRRKGPKTVLCKDNETLPSPAWMLDCMP